MNITTALDEEGRTEIIILFDRRLISAAIDAGSNELTVIVSLVDGRYTYGSAPITLTPHHDTRLADFASQWLRIGAHLDADINADNIVDLLDFSILANE